MSCEGKEVSLAISQIRLDGGTQLREKIDGQLVQEYAEQMAEGAAFPRVVVFFDGQTHWLADGFHRLEARRSLGHETLDCVLYEGGRREAILVAVRANATHGLRRTNADKRRAVEALLGDEEWSQKSTRWIADTCGVSRFLVEGMRGELAENATRPIEGASQRVGMDGKLHPSRRAADCAAGDASAADPVDAALQCGPAFDACLTHLRQAAEAGERLSRLPGGTFLEGARMDGFRRYVVLAAGAISDTRPECRCEACRGAGCGVCAGIGWLCPAARQVELRMAD